MPDNPTHTKEAKNMKTIRIVIEITYETMSEAPPETEAVDEHQTTLSDAQWKAYGEGRKDIEKEIIEAASVADLLALQEKVNSQIGQPKPNYGNGRKVHTCTRCGAPHRRSLERLNGRCLDCEDDFGEDHFADYVEMA
jgi:hypothetical protein